MKEDKIKFIIEKVDNPPDKFRTWGKYKEIYQKIYKLVPSDGWHKISGFKSQSEILSFRNSMKSGKRSISSFYKKKGLRIKTQRDTKNNDIYVKIVKINPYK